MSTNILTPTTGALSPSKLRGIYWKTFVGFISKSNTYAANDTPSTSQLSRMQQRQGSFEYMELTARGGSAATSESADSCASSATSSMESLKEDRSSMYAELDMSHSQKEISLNNDVTIIEEPSAEQGFDIKETHSLLASPISLLVASPKCSPIFVTGTDSTNHPKVAALMQNDRHLYNKETVDNDKLSVDDESEENSFDRLESTSPSMEPAPWKDQNLSIQLWMVPHFLSENDDKLVSMPPFPEFDHCHYVPTLEAILEESEESSDSRNISRSRLTKSASYSDDTDLNSLADELNQKRSNSLGDVVSALPHSQDDLYSITSTFGSINSMKRIATFENLSTEEKDGDEGVVVDSDGSSDEWDRAACYDSASDKNSLIENCVEQELLSNPCSSEISQCERVEARPRIRDIQEEVGDEVAGSEAATNVVCDKTASERYRDESAANSLVSTDFLSSGRSSPMIESAPEFYEFFSGLRSQTPSIRRDSGVTVSDVDAPNYYYSDASKPSTFSRDSGVTICDLDVPGLPKELYFDSKDLPQIVVMFAQQEIEKERRAKEEEEKSISPASTNGRYRERRPDHENRFEALHGAAVQKRISQLKIEDTSRLSTLSSSSPELSAVNDECLLYIPVSYASEAAAKKKRKRNVHPGATGAVQRRTNLSKAHHTRSLISGTGLGNGFSSLRKKLRSRKSASTSLRRSQSEKPQLSYSSPDVSGPMARFLNSPRRRAKLKSESPPDPGNDERKGKSIKKTFSKVLRRLSSKFSSQRRPVVVKRDYKVVEESSLANPAAYDEYAEDTSETQSSQSKDSTSYSPYKYGLPNDLMPSHKMESTFYREYRNRSHSVPMRPRSQASFRNGSTGSDVFDSIQSEDSLDKTVYV